MITNENVLKKGYGKYIVIGQYQHGTKRMDRTYSQTQIFAYRTNLKRHIVRSEK